MFSLIGIDPIEAINLIGIDPIEAINLQWNSLDLD